VATWHSDSVAKVIALAVQELILIHIREHKFWYITDI